ncbi:MFS transporter [Solihabitans fulvus]|uniref:MFS transporter n=1 Tax=Solihabitans fulvus TaxID=1892852 RepID=A0A5B2WYQ1_9PSEU|nr:MFS transporter [Solihabitans fulvus]KAA2256715.1 MFS transporter [Solihabitans fulvus]
MGERDATRARTAIAAVFAVHGAAYGSVAARIPWVQGHVQVGAGALGLALLAPAVGAMALMPFTGSIVHRFSGRTITRATLALWCIAIVLPALAPNLPVLCVAFLAYGASSGVSDVAMNAQGVVVEQRLGRPIMSALHGMWSVGALAGSGVGALAAHATIDARVHLTLVALVLVAAGSVACHWLLDTQAVRDDRPPRFARPSRAVLAIGVIGFCATFAEGSSSNWCAVYLRDVAGAGPGIAAAAYTAFACTMAVGRLAGNLAIARLGAVRTVRLSGLIGTVGAVLVVFARTPVLGIVGFALLGIGVAVVVPLAFVAAASSGPHPGQAIAGVATLTYGAGLVAPAAIGGIADATSLSVSFALVAVLVIGVVFAAPALRPRTPFADTAPSPGELDRVGG